MLILLSPSKTQDIETLTPTELFFEPLFEQERWELVTRLRNMSKEEIMSVMKISEKIYNQNSLRIDSWTKRHSQKNSKQAIHCFTGSVYNSFKHGIFTKREYAYMQEHIIILSGLYGVLRPLDLMQPYRLEMGTKMALKIDSIEYKNLYNYWSDPINHYLQNNKQSDIVINLTSEEYSKVIDRDLLGTRWIDVEFLQQKNNELKQVTIYTKMERGALSAWMTHNSVTDPDLIKEYDQNGYIFSEEKSGNNKFVFIRKSVQ